MPFEEEEKSFKLQFEHEFENDFQVWKQQKVKGKNKKAQPKKDLH